MSINRVRSAILATAVCAAVVTAVTVSPSAVSAGSTASTCPSAALCLYEGTGFTGEMISLTSLSRGGTCVSLVDQGWGDRAHSVQNTHNTSASMFANDNCVGGPYQVSPGSGISNLGSFSPESVWVPHWSS